MTDSGLPIATNAVANDAEPFQRYLPQAGSIPVKSSPTHSAQNSSIFGVDSVLQKELISLQKIIAMEQAEAKMQAERQRVIDAERDEKAARKQVKRDRKGKSKAHDHVLYDEQDGQAYVHSEGYVGRASTDSDLGPETGWQNSL